MEWTLFADLADVAGDRRVDVDVGAGATVDEALAALLDARPALRERAIDDDGSLHDHLNVLLNGENVEHAEGLATTVETGDELALLPPVSGG